MKDYIYFTGSLLSASLSFIQELIPVLQVILLTISLVLTLVGIGKELVVKLKNKEGIDIEDIKKANDIVKETINKIEKVGKENGRKDKEE